MYVCMHMCVCVRLHVFCMQMKDCIRNYMHECVVFNFTHTHTHTHTLHKKQSTENHTQKYIHTYVYIHTYMYI